MATQKVFLTAGTTSWIVPPLVSSVSVECLGSGGPSNTNRGGGGGGAYAANPAYPVTALASIPVRVGAVGGGLTTYFDTTGVVADFGRTGSTSGGAGGLASNSTGTTTYSGGNGGGPGSNAGGGGGGAAGPAGAGANGGSGTSGGRGGGGGGANGGGVGGNASNTGGSGSGFSGIGGTGPTGAAGGASRLTTGTGNAGTQGSGGSGLFASGTGGANSHNSEWDSTHGCGSGAGGNQASIVAAVAGSYGHGSSGGNTVSSTNGGDGLIVITYDDGGLESTLSKTDPAGTFASDTAVTLGQVFSIAQAGYIHGVRIYNPDAFAKTVALYNQTTGTPSPIATATSPAVAGWVDTYFASPVAVSTTGGDGGGPNYTVAFFSNSAGYQVQTGKGNAATSANLSHIKSTFTYGASITNPISNANSNGYGVAPLWFPTATLSSARNLSASQPITMGSSASVQELAQASAAGSFTLGTAATIQAIEKASAAGSFVLGSSAAVQAPGQATSSGSFVLGQTATVTTYDSDAIAYFTAIAATGVAFSSSAKLAFDTFIRGMKSAGLWTGRDWISSMGENVEHCRVNMRNPSQVGSFVGAGTRTFTAGAQIYFNGSHLESGVNLSTASQMTQNSVSAFFYDNLPGLVTPSGSGGAFGALLSGNGISVMPDPLGNQIFVRANSAGSFCQTIGSAPYPDLYSVNRTASTSFDVYRGKTFLQNRADTSTAVVNQTIKVGSQSGSTWQESWFCFGDFGKGLTGTERDAYVDLHKALGQSLGYISSAGTITAAQSFVLGSSASVQELGKATATGSFLLGTSATLTTPEQATASGSFIIGSSASIQELAQASAAGSFTIGGAATASGGNPAASLAGSGSFVIGSSASIQELLQIQALGAFTLGTAATIKALEQASAAGSFTLGGSGTIAASAGAALLASQSFLIGSAATIKALEQASAAGSFVLSGSAFAAELARLQASGSFVIGNSAVLFTGAALQRKIRIQGSIAGPIVLQGSRPATSTLVGSI